MFEAAPGYSDYFNLRGYRDIETDNRPKSTAIFAPNKSAKISSSLRT